MKKFLFLLAFFTLCLACDQTNTEVDKNIIKIDINPANSLKFSDLFEQATYIPLETTDNSLVGEVDLMKIVNNKLYLLTNSTLISFDTQTGKAYLQLSKRGGGEGEYTYFRDFEIDDNGTIHVLDWGKIKRYTSEGDYINEIEIPFAAYKFKKINDTDYWLYNKNHMGRESSYRLTLYDTANRLIKKEYLPIDDHLAGFYNIIESSNFSGTKEVAFFANEARNVWHISPDTIVKAYRFDFLKNNMPEEFLARDYTDIADFATKAMENNYVYAIGNLIENNTTVAFSFYSQQKGYWAFYDKKEGLTHTANTIIDDFHIPGIKMELNYYNLMTSHGNTLYFLLQPSQFTEALEQYLEDMPPQEKDNYLSKYPVIRQMYEPGDSGDESNPLLVVCRM